MRAACLALFALLCASPARAFQVAGGPAAPAPPALENCIPAAETAALRAAFPAVKRPAPARLFVPLYADPIPDGTNSFGRTVTNYVDLDPTAGLLDWNCGATTYDGHAGIDTEIRDFYDMDAGVPVLCAAPGTVVGAHDGEFDRRTAWINGVVANHAIVQHGDGSYAYYWHMRNGSVRVTVGQPVATGDTLGMIGSSGFSSGPHLHFETWDGATREPNSGACQSNPSLWQSPQPYVWTHPVEVFNHGATTLALNWPTLCERPPSKTHVVAGSTVYSWIRARNLATTDLVSFRFWSPLGLWGSANFNPSASYSSSWWYVSGTLPTSPTTFGAWHVDVLVNGVLRATQPFTVNAAANQAPTIASRTVYVPRDGSVLVDLAGADPDGSVFWHDVYLAPTQGAATLSNTRRHLLSYVPNPGFLGEDSVLVRARDDENAAGPVAAIRFVVTDLLDATTAPAAGLALAPIVPNPLRRDGRIAFTLPRPGDARLELLDLAGRRLAEWRGADLGAGAHDVAFGALAPRAPLGAGVYFVRLTALGESRARRVCVTN